MNKQTTIQKQLEKSWMREASNGRWFIHGTEFLTRPDQTKNLPEDGLRALLFGIHISSVKTIEKLDQERAFRQDLENE